MAHKDTVRRLVVVLVRVTKYDAEGYLVQFCRGILPSNSLYVMQSLTEKAFASPAFAGLDCQVYAFDETVMKRGLNPVNIMEKYGGPGTKVVVGFVGVQTNMFPRASDLASEFRKLGADVVIGGFHVSGSISMIYDQGPRVMPAELSELMEKGVILFHGEAEEVWKDALGDIVHGRAGSLYRGGLPDLASARLPVPNISKGFLGRLHTLDTSRGCLFNCGFCTVINVQGRAMRCRRVEHILAHVYDVYLREKGTSFFFTDDDFARNPNWREILEGLARMREQAGFKFQLMVQCDTQAWTIPGFVELLARAGCWHVFLGVESVRKGTLKEEEKNQNRPETYSEMCACFHKAGIACQAAVMLGFPQDTPETVTEDIEAIKAAGFDLASFFIRMPLPGSRDHQKMLLEGSEMDPDWNNYDSFQPVTPHPRMTKEKLQATYNSAWEQFYEAGQMTAALNRVDPAYYWDLFRNFLWYRSGALAEGVHPMMSGLGRHRHFGSRRKSAPRMSYPKHLWGEVRRYLRYARFILRNYFILQEVYFATRFVAKAGHRQPGLMERRRAMVQAFGREWTERVHHSHWFGKTFGRAAHREWLNAFWRGYAALEWRLIYKWNWHLRAVLNAFTEMVYAVRFSVRIFLALRQS